MSLLLEMIAELLLQVIAEIAFEAVFRIGDFATRGRMRRVLLFGVAGAAVGFGSHFIRPQLVFPDRITRYAAVGGLAIGAGLVLAIVEARVLRGGPGAAAAGFLSGVVFSLAYAMVRHLLLF